MRGESSALAGKSPRFPRVNTSADWASTRTAWQSAHAMSTPKSARMPSQAHERVFGIGVLSAGLRGRLFLAGCVALLLALFAGAVEPAQHLGRALHGRRFSGVFVARRRLGA